MRPSLLWVSTHLGLFRRDLRGANAVEFAMILPVMIFLYIGGLQLTQGVSAYRKVTVTARTVADLATQYTSMSATDVSNVLNASAQIMYPFPSSGLKIVLTEFSTSLSGVSTVTWSKTLNGTALTQGQVIVLPTNICQPGASVVRADVSYTYTPAIGTAMTGSIPLASSLYMSPRQIQSIPYTGP